MIDENNEEEKEICSEIENSEEEKSEIKYIKSEDIKEFIKTGSKIIFLYMPNSSPSQFQEERLIQGFESFDNKISIAMLDVLNSQEYPISMKIREFPTTMYFKDGNLILSESGVQVDVNNAIMQII